MEVLVVHGSRTVAAKIYAILRNEVFPAAIHLIGRAEALTNLRFDHVRLVVLDWELAWSTGKNALERIKSAAPHSHVIVRCCESQRQDALEAGADACVTQSQEDQEGVDREALLAAARRLNPDA